MSTMKEKLAKSVRQAKSTARPATQRSRAAKEVPPVAPAAPPAPPGTAVSAVPAGSRPPADAHLPAPSARELFPRRVWPD